MSCAPQANQWIVAGLLLGTFGCVQASHETFVRRYYDKLRDDVDRFIQDKWRPRFLGHVVEGRSTGARPSARTWTTPINWRRSTGCA